MRALHCEGNLNKSTRQGGHMETWVEGFGGQGDLLGGVVSKVEGAT